MLAREMVVGKRNPKSCSISATSMPTMVRALGQRWHATPQATDSSVGTAKSSYATLATSESVENSGVVHMLFVSHSCPDHSLNFETLGSWSSRVEKLGKLVMNVN